MEYYLSTEKEILPHAVAWMNLEYVVVSEIDQTHKGKHCMISLLCAI
jgi:hypothetical protein